MLKQKFIAVVISIAALIAGLQVNSLAFTKRAKRTVTFTVRVENIASKDGLTAVDGSKYPFALSPGLFVLSSNKSDFFKEGKTASVGLERQAEDGNPSILAKELLTKVGSVNMGVFNKPVGSDKASPILPGGAFEFTFTATEGMKLNVVTMYGQSNDLFYAPAQAIELFDKNGNPLKGDCTSAFQLWDAGTEVNQAPGIGSDQGPRQKEPNTGAEEKGVVHLVNDGFTYPETKYVLRITITAN